MRETAGELSRKALSDTTRYDAREIGYAQLEAIDKGLRECIELYRPIFDMDEFCVGFILGSDPIIPNASRRKFHAFPWLPKPRPNQSMFLYNKGLDIITKRLWVMPRAEVMAELATTFVTDELAQRQQAWVAAFYAGTFWEYIRYEHGIDMLSETELLLKHREELIKAGCKVPDSSFTEPFDFGKVHIKNLVETGVAISS